MNEILSLYYTSTDIRDFVPNGEYSGVLAFIIADDGNIEQKEYSFEVVKGNDTVQYTGKINNGLLTVNIADIDKFEFHVTKIPDKFKYKGNQQKLRSIKSFYQVSAVDHESLSILCQSYKIYFVGKSPK